MVKQYILSLSKKQEAYVLDLILAKLELNILKSKMN